MFAVKATAASVLFLKVIKKVYTAIKLHNTASHVECTYTFILK